jgi:hypothetical protein
MFKLLKIISFKSNKKINIKNKHTLNNLIIYKKITLNKKNKDNIINFKKYINPHQSIHNISLNTD